MTLFPSMSSFSDELLKIAVDAAPKLKKEDVKEIEREVELWNKLRGISPVKVKIDRKAAMHGGGYFDQQAKMIGMSTKDYETLAHEIGHAELDKRILGKLLQHPINRAFFPWTPVAGALAGVGLAKGKKWPLAIPALTSLPTLLSERWATRKGSKALKGVGATKKEIEDYKKVLKESGGTYDMAVPAAMIAGLMGFSMGAAQ